MTFAFNAPRLNRFTYLLTYLHNLYIHLIHHVAQANKTATSENTTNGKKEKETNEKEQKNKKKEKKIIYSDILRDY